jgi:hypothetical protein
MRLSQTWSSFDLARYGISPAARRTLTGLISHGGRVIWGACHVITPAPVETAAGLLASACASLSLELTPSRVLAASLVSTSCGTGLASIDDEPAIAANVRAAAALARAGGLDPAPDPLPTATRGTIGPSEPAAASYDGPPRVSAAHPPDGGKRTSTERVQGTTTPGGEPWLLRTA